MNAKQPLSVIALAIGLVMCGAAQANENVDAASDLVVSGAVSAVAVTDTSSGEATTDFLPKAQSIVPNAAFAMTTVSADHTVPMALASAGLTSSNTKDAGFLVPATEGDKVKVVVAEQALPVAKKVDTVAPAEPADATEPVEEVEEFADPYERVNRNVYALNETVDKAAVKPLARAYQKVVPKGPRLCVSNMFSNLGEPYTAVNNLLQGKPKAMFQDIGRLLINSTLGIGGCIDVASQWGIPKHREDFGQTLAVWGVPSGPYVVLPVLGPSTVRDALSKPVDFLANPVGYITNVPLRNSLQGYKMLDTRTNLLETTDTLEQSALDPYVMARDAWMQRRLAQIKDEDSGYDNSSPRDGAPRQLEIAPRSAVIE